MPMMLDTNVVSDLREGKTPQLKAWLARTDTELCISCVTVAELQFGASRIAGRRPEFAADLENWIDQIVANTPVVPLDATASRLLGRMQAVPDIKHLGASPRFGADLAIAATAIVARCSLATLNVRDFHLIALKFPNLIVVNPLEQT